ncbi:MAG: hypothetical protein AB1638_10310 [Nitrospirota bacterium]
MSFSGLTPVSSTGQAPNPVILSLSKDLDYPIKRLCRNYPKRRFVILNPSPVILSIAKNLAVLLRVNSVKNLMESMSYKVEILRLKPQNDIATQSPSRAMTIIE